MGRAQAVDLTSAPTTGHSAQVDHLGGIAALTGTRPCHALARIGNLGPVMPVPQFTVRRARTRDVVHIRRLIDEFGGERRVLTKTTVNLYEDVQEFWVAEHRATSHVVGCGALHVMWEDLAEVRTLAVDRSWRRRGIGHLVLEQLLDVAVELGVSRVFCLTFEVDFFVDHGFAEVDGTPIEPDVHTELLRSYDEGVAEFLDLDRVRPNTLGNTRMIQHLH